MGRVQQCVQADPFIALYFFEAVRGPLNYDVMQPAEQKVCSVIMSLSQWQFDESEHVKAGWLLVASAVLLLLLSFTFNHFSITPESMNDVSSICDVEDKLDSYNCTLLYEAVNDSLSRDTNESYWSILFSIISIISVVQFLILVSFKVTWQQAILTLIVTLASTIMALAPLYTFSYLLPLLIISLFRRYRHHLNYIRL